MLRGRPTGRDHPAGAVVVCAVLLLLTGGRAHSALPCAGPPKPAVEAAFCQRELRELNARLQDLLTRFTDGHPDVRALRHRIELLGDCPAEAAAPGVASREDCEPSGQAPSPGPPADTLSKPPQAARTPVTPVAASEVVIDPEATHQVMAGFGTSHRNWDDPHVSNVHGTVIPPAAQHEILTRLYTDLGLTRVRPTVGRGIEPVNDNADPFTSDRSRFDFHGRNNDDSVRFVKQAIPYGVRTFWLSPSPLELWMNEGNPDEYVEWAMAILLRWRQLGLELPYYSPVNEPAQQNPRLSAAWMTEVVKRLGRRMREAGLRTKLVAPDDLNPTEAYKRIVPLLEDAEARQYLGALAYHLYSGDRYRPEIRDLARKYGIPVWMSEYSERSYATYSGALLWAQKIHQLITESGVSAVDYLAGFFGSWQDQGAHSLVNVDFDGGIYRGYRLSAAYYLTGQYSRFVRPGYVRVDAHWRMPGIHVSAFKGPAEIVVVVINSNPSAWPVEIEVAARTALQPVSSVRTSPSERWQQLPAITPSGSRFSSLLPGESVTTFVARFAASPSER